MADSCIPPATVKHHWVCIGDTWADNDARMEGRTVLVLQPVPLSRTHVEVRDLASDKVTRLRADRMRPTSTGFRLVHKHCPDHRDLIFTEAESV